jgi:hypothetical protein
LDLWWPLGYANKRMQKIESKYPDLVELDTYGTTTRCRPIYGITAGNRKNCIALLGAVHPGESGPEIIIPVLERILENHSHLLEKTGIAAIPSVNADMREMQVKGHPGYIRHNPNGVDLNRNFDADWEKVNDMYGFYTSDPHGHTYKGYSAGCESETEAVVNFIKKIKPMAVFSFHFLSCICNDSYIVSKHAKGDDDYINRCLKFCRLYSRGFGDNDNIEKRIGFFASEGSLPHWAYKKGVPMF